MKLTEEKEQEQKEGGKRADFGGMPLSVVRKPGEKTEKSKQASKTDVEIQMRAGHEENRDLPKEQAELETEILARLS